MAMTRHLMDPTVLVYSMSEWKKLNQKEQAAMLEAAELAAEKVRSMAPAKEKESLEAVKKLGMKVNDLDTAPLQKAAMAAQDDLAKDFGAESLLATIRKQ